MGHAMSTAIWIVFAKEVIDNLRDRRSLLLGLVYPLLGPILLSVMVSLASGVIEAGPEERVRLAIDGARHAPELVAYLEDQGITVLPAPADGEAAVRDGRLDTMIQVPGDFDTRFQAGRPVTIQVYIHPARLPGMVGANRLFFLLGEFNRAVGQRRLAKQGIDLQAAVPVIVESVNVAAGADVIDIFLFMVPPFFIFTVFMGGVYLALDTTSGERERGSLEPLLANPVPRWGLMVGKFLAAVVFTAIALIVQLAAFKIMFAMAGDAGANFARILDVGTMLAVFLVALPLMLLAVAVQITIAIVSRSFKEAQTYLGLLPLVPAMPGMALVFFALETEAWMMAVPTFGQTLLFGQLVRGEGIDMANAGLCVLTTTLAALALLAIAGRLYEREELIFGGR